MTMTDVQMAQILAAAQYAWYLVPVAFAAFVYRFARRSR